MSKKENTKKTFTRMKGAEWLLVNLGYVFFIVLLGVVYIYNTHASERSMRKIYSLKKEVEGIRWQAMDLEKELMYESTQSQLSKNLEETGLKPLNKLPLKLQTEIEVAKK